MKLKILIVSFLSMCLFNLGIANANTQEGELVRVGIFSGSKFNAFDEKGVLYGVNIEFLEEIAKYANFRYRYVFYDTLDAALNGIKHNEVDLVGDVIRYPNREKYLAYSDFVIGRTDESILTSINNANLNKEKLRKYDRVKVGILANYEDKEGLKTYIDNWSMHNEFVEYRDVQEMIKGMGKKDVDFIVCNRGENMAQFAVFDYFSMKPVYYVVNKENSQLLNKINAAGAAINQNTPKFFRTVEESVYSQPKIAMSLREWRYISEHPVINIGVKLESPMAYYNESTGTLEGIYVELLQRIEEKSGMKFNIVPIENQSLISFLKENDVKAVMGIDKTRNVMVDTSIQLSRTIMDNMIEFAVKKNTIVGHDEYLKIVIPYSNPEYASYVVKEFPKSHIVYANDYEECLNMVMNNKAQVTVMHRANLREYLMKEKYRDIGPVHTSGVMSLTGMATMRNADQLFVSILNKAISKLTDDEVNRIITKYSVLKPPKMSIMDYVMLYKDNFALGIVVMIILMVVVYQSYAIKAQKREQYRVIAELSETILFEYDAVHAQVYLSDRFFEEMGFANHSSNVISAADLMRRFNDDDKQKLSAAYQRMVVGKCDNFKLKLRMKDNSDKYLWYEITAQMMHKKGYQQKRMIGKMTNIDESMREKEELKALSERDQLSGLLNKVSLIARTRYYIEKNPDSQGAMFFIDIDNFKGVNDMHGHATGDKAIVDIAKKITAVFREGDIIGRFGGDEFFVFAKNIPNEVLEERGRQLCSVLKTTYISDKASVIISASIGIVQYPKCGRTVEELIENADKAAYYAKESGKNRSVIYSDDLVLNGYEGNRH